jgi:hypothetical protein
VVLGIGLRFDRVDDDDRAKHDARCACGATAVSATARATMMPGRFVGRRMRKRKDETSIRARGSIGTFLA